MQKLVFTNGGGQTIDLTSGNFGITNWEGLSGVSLNIQTQQVPFQDGGVFLDALMEQREISVTVAIQDNNDLSARYERKRQLISALNPKLGEGVLVYTNDYLSRQIKAVPQLPIFENKNSNDAGTLKANVTFSCPSPYWEDLEDTVVFIEQGLQKQIENSGDVPVGIEIDLSINEATSPRVMNLTENKKIKINGNWGNNIFISTKTGEKQVVTQNESLEYGLEGNARRRIIFVEDLGMFICLGNNIILTSSDGINWAKQTETEGTADICYSKKLGLFARVGGKKIFLSIDGTNWQEKEVFLGIREYNYGANVICYSESLGLFVAQGFYMYTSPDGINWTINTNAYDFSLNKIIYIEELNKFVGVGADGIIKTSPDGINWTSQTSGTSRWLWAIAYSEVLNMLVAVGDNGTIITSPDGINWTSQTSNFTRAIWGVSYINSQFIAECGYGSLLSSSDGVNWTSQQIARNLDALYSISYSRQLNLYAIAINSGEVGDSRILISSDNMESWESVSGNTYWLRSSVYSGKLKKYVAVGNQGTILTSSDGINWQEQNGGTVATLLSIIYSEEFGLFIVGGGNIVLTSPDGINWEIVAEGRENAIYGYCTMFIKDLNKFIIIGDSNDILVSLDGRTWTKQYTFNEKPVIYNAVYSKKLNLIVGVGSSGGIITSSDGENWTLENSNITDRLTSITYSEDMNLFVAIAPDSTSGDVGYNDSVILTSPDGINWTRNVGGVRKMQSIAYIKEFGKFLCAGSSDLAQSLDGLNWKRLFYGDFGTESIIYSRERNESLFVGNRYATKIKLTKGENIISSVTADSDISLALNVGVNDFAISTQEGEVNARIKYRQKYIGV
jgi:predicted phage tail component-like protein